MQHLDVDTDRNCFVFFCILKCENFFAKLSRKQKLAKFRKSMCSYEIDFFRHRPRYCINISARIKSTYVSLLTIHFPLLIIKIILMFAEMDAAKNLFLLHEDRGTQNKINTTFLMIRTEKSLYRVSGEWVPKLNLTLI